MSNPIPLIYRIVFLYIDPAFCLLGATLHTFDTLTTLIGYSPDAATQFTTTFTGSPSIPVAVTHLLQNASAFYITLGLLEAILLRVKAGDVQVWRVVEGCVTVLDVLMVAAALNALNEEGRLKDVQNWRGDDWRLVAGNAGMGLIRAACGLGIGIAGTSVKKAKGA